MADWHSNPGPFDIHDVPDYIPLRLKPWLFILFVLIIQFSGGVYLAAATSMVGSTALMQEDILMAGYAQLIGMSINFCVMFRLKFRYSNRISLLVCCMVLLAANYICANTDSVPVLVLTCLVAGWFRMWATFACNSTIQLWLTPVRDMAVFFCYVYLVVDGAIQMSGIMSVYTDYVWQWENIHVLINALLVLMMVLVLIFVKPFRGMPKLPLLGIDWIGAGLWSAAMLCFTFVCVYGSYFDWWDAVEIRGAVLLGLLFLAINLWRMTFLRHPYVSYRALLNRNVVRATCVYLVFFTLLATEHVVEHGYAAQILGYDHTNLIDLNWYVMCGIVAGVAFTYYTFAKHKWRYKTLTAIAFSLAAIYLAYFYFLMDYGVEKHMWFIPLFCRGMASVIISIIYLTSVQGGLPFQVFPQALVINGFTGAVMGATLGPAIVGEWLRHLVASNAALLGAPLTDFNASASVYSLPQLMGMVQAQAYAVSVKELYGWLLTAALCSIGLILVSYSSLRPWAYFPKWSTVRRIIRHTVREEQAERLTSGS
ncbi:MAG: hypothetical protein NC043_03755 [Muribaculaceae bacterium]|nr:hypothetical protein [Muribaculaceae bacterium]